MKNSNDTSWDRTSDLPFCSKHVNHCATAVFVELDTLEIACVVKLEQRNTEGRKGISGEFWKQEIGFEIQLVFNSS